MSRYRLDLVRDGETIPIEVEASYEGGSPGAREYRGGPLVEPDEPGYWMIEECWLDGTTIEVELTEAEQEALNEQLSE